MLLLLAAALLVLVPCGSAVAGHSSPSGRFLPAGFWIVWLLLSLMFTLYARLLVHRLMPPDEASHRSASYERWGILLGVLNVGWSLAQILR
jgi:hypothetical protein